jgi:hypothetical protein
MRPIGISTAVESARAVAGNRIRLVRLVAAGRSRVLAGFQSRQTTRTGVRSSPPHVSRVAQKHCSGLDPADVGGSKRSDARDPCGRPAVSIGNARSPTAQPCRPPSPARRVRRACRRQPVCRAGAMALQPSARGRWRSDLNSRVVPEPVGVVAFRGHGCWRTPRADARAGIACECGAWRGSRVLRSSRFIALSRTRRRSAINVIKPNNPVSRVCEKFEARCSTHW